MKTKINTNFDRTGQTTHSGYWMFIKCNLDHNSAYSFDIEMRVPAMLIRLNLPYYPH